MPSQTYCECHAGRWPQYHTRAHMASCCRSPANGAAGSLALGTPGRSANNEAPLTGLGRRRPAPPRASALPARRLRLEDACLEREFWMQRSTESDYAATLVSLTMQVGGGGRTRVARGAGAGAPLCEARAGRPPG